MQLTCIFATALALAISAPGVLALPSSQRDQDVAARSGADTTSVDAAPSNLLRRLINEQACMSTPCGGPGSYCPARCGPCTPESASLSAYYCSDKSSQRESLFDHIFH